MSDLEEDLLTLHEDILEENEEGIKEIFNDFKDSEESTKQLCTREIRLQECDPEWGRYKIFLVFDGTQYEWLNSLIRIEMTLHYCSPSLNVNIHYIHKYKDLQMYNVLTTVAVIFDGRYTCAPDIIFYLLFSLKIGTKN